MRQSIAPSAAMNLHRTNKVAVYVQGDYAKPTYKNESYDKRAWPGLEMICHVLRAAGVEVEYCSSATVGKYEIVLVSITSGCDWHSFVRERLLWKDSPIVIAGGAGLLNVRPFLRWVDIFCLGRAENYITPLVHAVSSGEKYEHPSVCYAADFDINKTYLIDAGEKSYPHEVVLANGKAWRESAIGCQRKCLFCAYTWHRKHTGALQGESGAGAALWSDGREKTILELDLEKPETWGLNKLRMVGLDGLSERLRLKVKKPITREIFRKFLRGIIKSSAKPHQIKLYNIIGYPIETDDEWLEFVDDINRVDSEFGSDKQWSLVLHSTPFRAMPATPCACWPMSYRNYRGQIAKVLSGRKVFKGNIFFQGNRFWAVESMGTESLPTVILDALVLRGNEDDSEIIARLASNKKFNAASARHKIATLEKHCDIDRLFRAYEPSELPTRYLRTFLGDKMPFIDAMAAN